MPRHAAGVKGQAASGSNREGESTEAGRRGGAARSSVEGQAVRAGKKITRIALAFEAGRDGFWLARWLAARGVEAHVIHPSSVAISREHRRAKTDRLDTELLKRGFLGWLRGERGHCSMVRVPTIAEEDAKRPNRERECVVAERTRIILCPPARTLLRTTTRYSVWARQRLPRARRSRLSGRLDGKRPAEARLANIALSGIDNVAQLLERLLDRRAIVPAMDLIEIDVIGAEAPQARVDLS